MEVTVFRVVAYRNLQNIQHQGRRVLGAKDPQTLNPRYKLSFLYLV